MTQRRLLISMALLCMLLMMACGQKRRAPEAALDTPEHHVFTGNKFLKAGKLDEAVKEFNLATSLDPEFSPAYVGLGLVEGLKNDPKKGLELMEKAEKYAKSKNHEYAVYVGYIRLYSIGKTKLDDDWLDEAKDYHEKAIDLRKNDPEAYYYMGIAYKMAYEFTDSAYNFRKVLDIDKGFVEEANQEYEVIQKIERALPGSKVGKQIALLPKITRADVAALFIEELRIDKMFERLNKKKFDNSYKFEEQKVDTGTFVKSAPATDIADHVLKADIDEVLKIGIKGLQPYPDHTFQPYKDLTRAEFAIMIQDIMARITHDDSLETKFIGSNSEPLYPDLRTDQYFYNAVMVCGSLGIMHAYDKGTREFNPMGTISGADALLSIREMKILLDKY